MMKTKRDRQIERETSQVAQGVARYQKQANSKSATDMTPGKIMMVKAIQPVANAIEAELARPRNRWTVASSYFEQLEPLPVAYITARIMINVAACNGKITKAAMNIGQLIEEHVQFTELDGEAPALSNSMQRKALKWTTSFHRRAIMRKAADIAEVRGLEWSDGDKLKLGMKLVELFITTTAMAEVRQTREGTKTIKRVRLHEDVAQRMAKHHEELELLTPFREPMIVPPKRWVNPISGGFLTGECRQDFVLQTSAAKRDDLFSTDLTDVYRAVNAIQETPWQINRAVYDVAAEAWNSKSLVGSLPPADPLPIPERPDSLPPREVDYEDMSPGDQAKLNDYRGAARAAHEMNSRLHSQRYSVIRQLAVARDLVDEEEIFFPHNVDFRGRIYPLVPDLSPQSDDLGKGLLQFAKGKPLGTSGAYWLAVHIANLFGIDKVSFDERVAWVQENSPALLDSARDPLDGQRFWSEADYPFCALAACMEWAGCDEGRDQEFISHIPIAMDGSCSGLQHFSAMLKDPVGAQATNLTNNSKPSDIYMLVAEGTEARLGKLGEPESLAWLGKVQRKIVKRPCMTFAYSVTSRGIRDQIMDECRKQADGGEYLPGYDNFTAATYLAPIVEESIRGTVDKAAVAMDWLKGVTKVLLQEEMPVLWRTPDGFPVVQKYVKSNGKKFKVYFQGQRMRLTLQVATTKPDPRKQASAVAPNFVHSMDACHLRMVVNRLMDEGITRDFAMIHDSFGTHACDVDELHFAIRDEFISLYSVDRLTEFYQQALLSVPGDKWEEIPTVPEMGTFNLEEVRDADFFFA